MLVEFLVSFRLAPMDFSADAPVSLPPEKPTFPKSFLYHIRILCSGGELAFQRGLCGVLSLKKIIVICVRARKT